MIDSMVCYIDEMSAPVQISVNPGENKQLVLRFEQKTTNHLPHEYSRQLSIRVAPGGSLELYILSALPEVLNNVVHTAIFLQDRSSLKVTELILDEGEGTYHTEVVIEGTEAAMDYAGAYGARKSTKRIHTIQTHHVGKHSTSRTRLHSALKDSAYLEFRGLIHVDNRATGTDAYLSNRNMIMNDGCQAESLPQLQIETDDVICSHGSTTGGPREEELFYLMSRGLTQTEAKGMLVMGNLSSVMNRFPAFLAEEAENAVSSLLLGDTGPRTEVA